MKIIILILFFFSFANVNALSNIKINNESLTPFFDENTYEYNYFTDEDAVKIYVEKDKDEIVTGYGYFNITDGMNTFNVTSNGKAYKINVYKNYIEDNSAYFEYLNIKGLDINFDNNIFDYYINTEDIEYLEFDYSPVSYDSSIVITNNGDFNNKENIVSVSISNEESKNVYYFHVNKNIDVNNNINETKSVNTKYVILIIVLIMSIIYVLSFYLLFKRKILVI